MMMNNNNNIMNPFIMNNNMNYNNMNTMMVNNMMNQLYSIYSCNPMMPIYDEENKSKFFK